MSAAAAPAAAAQAKTRRQHAHMRIPFQCFLLDNDDKLHLELMRTQHSRLFDMLEIESLLCTQTADTTLIDTVTRETQRINKNITEMSYKTNVAEILKRLSAIEQRVGSSRDQSSRRPSTEESDQKSPDAPSGAPGAALMTTRIPSATVGVESNIHPDEIEGEDLDSVYSGSLLNDFDPFDPINNQRATHDDTASIPDQTFDSTFPRWMTPSLGPGLMAADDSQFT